MGLAFFDVCRHLTEELEEKEKEHITQAAEIVADGIMNGGITQAYGGGHSGAAAMEVSGRAGGLIPSKMIYDPAQGVYEKIEGVGTAITRKLMVHPHDVFFLISNSGRNPQTIELAQWIKSKGNKLIVVTSLESSKASTSRHSSGKLLYEFADAILDNHSVFGDSALSIEGMETKVCGTSSFAAVLLLQQTMYQAFQIMVDKGYIPPVYQSANIDGGPEYNRKLQAMYADRIYHF